MEEIKIFPLSWTDNFLAGMAPGMAGPNSGHSHWGSHLPTIPHPLYSHRDCHIGEKSAQAVVCKMILIIVIIIKLFYCCYLDN